MSICNCKTNRNDNTENERLFKGGRIFKREILLFNYTPPYAWGGGGGALTSIDPMIFVIFYLCI